MVRYFVHNPFHCPGNNNEVCGQDRGGRYGCSPVHDGRRAGKPEPPSDLGRWWWWRRHFRPHPQLPQWALQRRRRLGRRWNRWRPGRLALSQTPRSLMSILAVH